MCLILIGDSKERTATTDIVCYKFLTKKNNCLYSFYGEYTLGKTERLRKKLKIQVNYYSNLEYGVPAIFQGYHSYDEDGARNAKKFYPQSRYYKCIIPKGAKYYEGYHNNSYATGYVSSSLKIISAHRFKQK